MTFSDIISLFSGIALFLFGMSFMGDGLKHLSGNRLEPILYRLSGTPMRGLLLGSGVTAVIQSSAATSVIVVGFVNSGMMKLKQAIPVVLGSIFGTSITGWIICLSYIEGAGGLSAMLSTATLTGAVSIAGIILRTFCKGKLQHHIGDIMMGFAILMFGMSLMSSSVGGLKDQLWFNRLLTSMENPLLGLLAGFLIAAVLQSASAAVGVVQALSVTGAVVFDNAFPLLLGIAVGASVPVLLAAIGTNIDSRRTAVSYLAASAMGAVTCASVFYIADAVFPLGLTGLTMTPFSLALINTILRLCMVMLLIPFIDILEALVKLIVPEKTTAEAAVIALDDRFTRHPTLAIEQSRKLITDMAQQAEQAVAEAGILMGRYSDAVYRHVSELEQAGDRYEDVLGSFLMKLSGQELTDRQEQYLTIFLHTISDFERITDHAINIAESFREVNEKQLSFSEEAVREIAVISAAVREILNITVSAFTAEDLDAARQVEPLEEVIDGLCDEMKLHHIERLQQGRCGIHQGFVLNDLLTNYERISDHCSNIAVALIEVCSGSFATHQYLDHVKEIRSSYFEHYYNAFRERFSLRDAA